MIALFDTGACIFFVYCILNAKMFKPRANFSK